MTATANHRHQCITQAKALLDRAAQVSDRALLIALGAAERVACSDRGEHGGALIDEADALLRDAKRLAGRVFSVDLHTPALDAWLKAPQGPFATALTELSELGAIASALASLQPGSAAQQMAQAAVDERAGAILHVARAHSAVMLDAAVAASQRVVDFGVAPGPDDALLALSEVCDARIRAVLAGEALEAPRPFVRSVLSRDLAERLGEALAAALARPAPLAVAADALQLAPAASFSPRAELVLHGAAEAIQDAPSVELLPGVVIRYVGAELEVELAEDRSDRPILLPVSGEQPGSPCPARAGAHARHFVFTLPEAGSFLLLVGEQAAYLGR